jgi:pimeloyl-ACP methyl ester carboxylesterase
MPTVNIADIKIHYTRTGSEKSPRLVIFPDNHLTGSAFEKEKDHFSDRFEVITFDYPTTGKSTHEVKYADEREVDYWGFWADLTCHLLQELDINRCYALGVTGGALSALHFAVQGLVVDSFLADMDTRTLHRWLDVREHFYVRNEKALLAQHGENWRQVVAEDTHCLRRLADQGGYAVPESFINAIACPTLLTGYLYDRTLPGIADEYARISRLIPECSIYLSARSNHPYLERPYLWTDPAGFRTVADLFLNRWIGQEQ